MKFSILAGALALTSFVAAIPQPIDTTPNDIASRNLPWPNICLQPVQQQEAEAWIQQIIQVFTRAGGAANAQAIAEKIIANNFQEISNSILSLQSLPLTTGVSATSKEEWIQGLLHAPPFGGINTLSVVAGNCNQIVWYWQFNKIGSGQYPIKGFNLFTMQRNFLQLQATSIAVEFDSIAWSLDTGEGPCHK